MPLAKGETKLTLVSKQMSTKFSDGRTKAMENLDYEEILAIIMKCDLDSGYRAIAKRFGVTLTTLHEFLHLPAYHKRTIAANEIKGEAWAEKGWEILNAPESNNNWEENRVKHKAEWCAKMARAHSAKYREKLDITHQEVFDTPEQRQAKILELQAKAMGLIGEDNEDNEDETFIEANEQ